LTSMPPLVRISDLGLYLRCPRLVYFQSMGHQIWDEAELPFSLLLRDLALSLSDIEPESDLEAWLEERLERAKEDLPIVYRDRIDIEELRAAAEDVKELIPKMAEGLSTRMDLIMPSQTEVEWRSGRLGLSGRLDRLVVKEHPTPSVIRTGSPPDNGVWKSDRLPLTGYALLLEEAQNQRVDQGLVEYPLEGEIRKVEIRSVDRRRVLRIRDRVRQIKDGRLPDRPQDAPCQRCPFEEECQVRCSLASKFF
jgi:CRISPR-associated exonuclease Cas4